MTSTTPPRFKSKDGLAFTQTGTGVPIVFIHGVGLRLESWYQQVEALKDNFSIFTVDMPGHGESLVFEKDDPTLNDFTDKLAKFIIDEVQQPAVIVGHSMGGLLALSLAKDYPELCLALVPMNTIFKRSDEAKRAVLARAEKLTQLTHADACAPIARWFNEPLSKQDQVHAQMCNDWLSSANIKGYAAAYKVFAYEDGADSLTLSKFKIPVLYLTGELDMNSNISMTKAMASTTPMAEATIIKNSRHMTPLTHATEVNTALINFIQKRLVNKKSS